MNTPHVIAASFALAGFAATAIVGLYVGNPATLILTRAMLVMVVGWFIGRIVGGVMTKAIDDHIAAYRERRPLPDPELASPASATDATPSDAPSESATPTLASPT